MTSHGAQDLGIDFKLSALRNSFYLLPPVIPGADKHEAHYYYAHHEPLCDPPPCTDECIDIKATLGPENGICQSCCRVRGLKDFLGPGWNEIVAADMREVFGDDFADAQDGMFSDEHDSDEEYPDYEE